MILKTKQEFLEGKKTLASHIEEDDLINFHEKPFQNLTILVYNSRGDHKSHI